ncbi:tricarballylate utilization 4Fe-4S protein TcuB [Pelagibacterium sp.]|uniref:tricarballylate utilization 4Fe-4S protein TcuB n=1 Tax=Pelagibacterium sp. TaxID=1967288 RepID=UPI003A91D270
MSIDVLGPLMDGRSADEANCSAVEEARRQLEICNACRYCEGYCSVFPAMTLHRAFSDGEVTQLANLCHNCRGCYYACQYTEPHEFAVNLPRALAEVRVESWERFIWPSGFARLFQTSGVALAGALCAGIAVMIMLAYAIRPNSGEGFYAVISHTVMATLFTVSSFLPLIIIAAGLWSYWRTVGGERVRLAHLREAFIDAGRLKNLKGGAADGCNYEAQDRFTKARRWAHQAVMWGFVLCFAATTSGTIMHYGFGWEAPYGPLTAPKLFGVPGGILMTLGGGALIGLKLQAEKSLGAPAVWGGEMAFVLLLTMTAVTGLALYWATGTAAVPALLVAHLGAVLALFLTLPYTKMVHVPFRLAALVRDAQTKGTR